MQIIGYMEKQLPATLYAAERAVLSDKLNKIKICLFYKSQKGLRLIYRGIYLRRYMWNCILALPFSPSSLTVLKDWPFGSVFVLCMTDTCFVFAFENHTPQKKK
jgi:hypothetical protein